MTCFNQQNVAEMRLRWFQAYVLRRPGCLCFCTPGSPKPPCKVSNPSGKATWREVALRQDYVVKEKVREREKERERRLACS